MAEPNLGIALLLVEDDRDLREMLQRLLMDAGYLVDVAADGHTGLHYALTRNYGGMIIDRGLPAIEGLDLIARLRQRDIATPALVLTAYGTVADRVAGLDAGADDYVVKPFDIDELLARVRALVRRRSSEGNEVAIPGGWLDLVDRLVRRDDGSSVELSGKEAALLRLLANRPGRVYSRDELRQRIFDAAESESIVDTYVHYLRRKLGNDVVRTERGHGYRLGSR